MLSRASNGLQHSHGRHQAESITIIIPRWVFVALSFAIGSALIVFAWVLLVLYQQRSSRLAFQNEVNKQVAQQLAKQNNAICYGLRHVPSGPIVDDIRSSLKCPTFPPDKPSSAAKSTTTSSKRPGAVASGPGAAVTALPAPNASAVATRAPAARTSPAGAGLTPRPSAVHRSTNPAQPPTPKPIVTKPLPSPTTPRPRSTAPLLGPVCTLTSRLGLPLC
jgi:hypothetical protein